MEESAIIFLLVEQKVVEEEFVYMRYVLEHEQGENIFYNLRDAISCMYLISDYDSDSGASFSHTQQEIDAITSKVESGNYYENGSFQLFSINY